MNTQSRMRIWVDADACPRVIKDVLYRAAERRRISLILVANSRFPVPKSEYIEFLQVGAGFDKADLAIVEKAQSGDVVITTDNIRSRLTMRDFLDEMRGSGVMTGGPSALSARDRQEFANQLDRLLTARGF